VIRQIGFQPLRANSICLIQTILQSQTSRSAAIINLKRDGMSAALGTSTAAPSLSPAVVISDKLFGRLAAALEPISRSTHGIDKVMVGNRELEIREEIAYATPFGSLLHFKKVEGPEQPRLLLVAPMSGRCLKESVQPVSRTADVVWPKNGPSAELRRQSRQPIWARFSSG
jgi:hypothetical protein